VTIYFLILQNASTKNVVQRCSGSTSAIMRLLWQLGGCVSSVDCSRKTIRHMEKDTRPCANCQQNANMNIYYVEWKTRAKDRVIPGFPNRITFIVIYKYFGIFRLLKKPPTKIYTVNINPRLLPKSVVRLNLPTITNSWFFLPLGSCFFFLMNEWQLDWYNIKPYLG